MDMTDGWNYYHHVFVVGQAEKHALMSEVLTRIDKDERARQMMKQSMDLLPQGAKFIVGDFERLSV
jgi:hypothetical protein